VPQPIFSARQHYNLL